MTTLSPPPGFGALSLPPHEQSQVEKPKRSRDRRISWASGDKLCQVRLFVAEDAPVLSGAAQEQLQAKQARNLHVFNSVTRLPSSDAPPGFGGVVVKPKPDPVALAAIVPQISWRAPSVFKLDPTWLVMAGGASKEVGFQTQREVRVLEAVYPRPSSIPDSPAEPTEPQEPYDDDFTPQIPLVPLEEEDGLDGNDVSFGPRFLSQGSSGHVAGVQMLPPGAPVMSNGRLEKVMKPYIGENTPGTMQDSLQSRKEQAWRDSSSALPGRPLLVNHSSDPTSGRPSASAALRLLPDLQGTNLNGVEPDVAAAAAAAFAALSKSKEAGSMIDNQLLIQILSDPSLIQSLTAGSPFTVANSKSELSTSVVMDGTSRAPEKINQAHAMNGVTGGRNQWISYPSTSYSSVSTSGQDGVGPRIGETYSNGGAERFPRTAASDRTSNFVTSSVGNGALYSESTNVRRVGSGTVSKLSNNSGAPPGFGNSNTSANIPPGFGNNNSSLQQGSQTQLGPTPSRTLSRTDEQYFKSLIMQHGCADDDDHGRAGTEIQSNSNAVRLPGTFSASEASRWYGREEVDGGRPERSGRERRENEKNGTERPKSRKVCIYYGTPRGCRNGDSCTFVHELTDSDRTRAEKVRNAPTHLQYAKRLKVDG